MSKGDRGEGASTGIVGSVILLIVFVIGIVAIWLYSEEGPKPVANSYEASGYHESAQKRIKANCVALEGVRLTECLIKIEQSERENHRAQKDLRAQRYMAVWAFVMAFAAIGTLGVTAVGLAWIKATLDETRRAASSADDAVTVTREIGQAQVRAYISVLDVRVISHPYAHTVKWRIIAQIRNTGQSPAQGMRLRASMSGEANKARSSFTIPDIGANTTITYSTNIHVHEDELRPAGHDGNLISVNVGIAVTGKDVFGKDLMADASFAGTSQLIDGADADINRVQAVNLWDNPPKQ